MQKLLLKNNTERNIPERIKKKTGKGSDLHVSINPRAVKEASAFLGLSST